MSQKKARLKAFGNTHAKIEEYVNLYMHALRALINSLPPGADHTSSSTLKIVTLGLAEIWPCIDGAVVLVYSTPSNDIRIRVQEPLSKTVNDFLKTGSACAFYDEHGLKAKFQAMIQIEDASKSIVQFADWVVEGPNGKIFRTKYDRGSIIGWNATLPKPDEEALKDFRAVYLARNVVGPEAENLPQKQKEAITKSKADALLAEYKALLNDAQKEEDLQKFLTSHPEFIYPDFITCFPKFKLGEDYITDYVLLVQGHNGPEYVFVEIELV